MSELTPIADYVEAGLVLQMAQYKGKANVEALLTAFLGHHQRIEDALMQLREGRTLAAAQGATLDGLGRLVGADRNSLTDDAYRVFIYAKIAENYGDATLQTLLHVAAALFRTQAIFNKTPNTLARSGQNRGAWLALMVGSPGVPQELYGVIVKLLQQSLPAGVELAHLGLFGAKRAFAFAGPQPWVGGWGSINDPTAGAPIGGLLYNATT